MNLSLNLSRLLHGVYPVMVLTIALMSWAGMVQGNEKYISFQPPDPHTYVSLSASPPVCSAQDPFFLKRPESCPDGEQALILAQKTRSEREPASDYGDFVLKN